MTRLYNTCNVHIYHGSSHIQIANESHLAIEEVGDINSYFRDVYVSLKLYTNLIVIGQLVDDNCDVYFSHNGCLVQDQMSSKTIVKRGLFHYTFPFLIYIWLV